MDKPVGTMKDKVEPDAASNPPPRRSRSPLSQLMANISKSELEDYQRLFPGPIKILTVQDRMNETHKRQLMAKKKYLLDTKIDMFRQQRLHDNSIREGTIKILRKWKNEVERNLIAGDMMTFSLILKWQSKEIEEKLAKINRVMEADNPREIKRLNIATRDVPLPKRGNKPLEPDFFKSWDDLRNFTNEIRSNEKMENLKEKFTMRPKEIPLVKPNTRNQGSTPLTSCKGHARDAIRKGAVKTSSLQFSPLPAAFANHTPTTMSSGSNPIILNADQNINCQGLSSPPSSTAQASPVYFMILSEKDAAKYQLQQTPSYQFLPCSAASNNPTLAMILSQPSSINRNADQNINRQDISSTPSNAAQASYVYVNPLSAIKHQLQITPSHQFSPVTAASNNQTLPMTSFGSNPRNPIAQQSTIHQSLPPPTQRGDAFAMNLNTEYAKLREAEQSSRQLFSPSSTATGYYTPAMISPGINPINRSAPQNTVHQASSPLTYHKEPTLAAILSSPTMVLPMPGQNIGQQFTPNMTSFQGQAPCVMSGTTNEPTLATFSPKFGKQPIGMAKIGKTGQVTRVVNNLKRPASELKNSDNNASYNVEPLTKKRVEGGGNGLISYQSHQSMLASLLYRRSTISPLLRPN